jgi:serine/threonine protein kinase
VIIEYEPYDYLLADFKSNLPLPQTEVEKIIYSVCSGLQFMETKKCRHGDISAKTICKYKDEWKLIDNYFVKGGITAY